jgi:hypothetical protein
MKRIIGLLTLLVIFTLTSPQALGQFCTTGRHFPNYMYSVDGYAPADYDGDGLADWAIKDFSGAWTIDYSANGLNGYDQTFFGYGGQSNLPVPHDYDGDGLADLAVKSNTQGSWSIDYASNGFGVWDATYWGYGGAENRPVPADYDGDGRADLSVKSSTTGRWNIDYAANGYGTWDVSLPGYGGAENIPVPAHYGNDDLKADLAVWVSSGPWNGTFNIDLSFNGFGTWDRSFQNVLPGPGRPAAGDFNGDTFLDFSVKGDDGVWRILLQGGFGSPCSPSTFIGYTFQSFAGYGDTFHRPVPHKYSNFIPGAGGCCFGVGTDLAVRKESAPRSVAIDFLTGGLGAWDYVYSP